MIVQETFEVIVNVPEEPDADPMDTEEGETDKEAADPAWVTVTV